MEKPNLKQIATNCKTFEEFRLKRELIEKLDRLQREQPHPDHYTKQQPRQQNLKELARSSMSFSDFHQKASEGLE